MKNLITTSLASILSLNLMAATPTYKLNAEKMSIGKISQANEKSATASFIIKRTASTPKQVEIEFNFDEYYSYCVQSEIETYWVPAKWENVCHAHKQSNGEVVEFCSDEYIPGHEEYRTVCVEYDYAAKVEVEELKLDFKKARKLTGQESETFVVELKQESFTSEQFDISIKTKSSKSKYEITRKKVLLWKTFGFSFKAI